MIYRKKRKMKNGVNQAYGRYLIRFKDHQEILRQLIGYSSKRDTESLERGIKELVAIRQSGGILENNHVRFIQNCRPKILDLLLKWKIIDAGIVAGNKPLLNHLEIWVSHMESKGFSIRHRAQCKARMERVTSDCKFFYWTDLSKDKVVDWINDRREEGMSVRTANSYIATIKAFCNFMIKSTGATHNPVSELSKNTKEFDVRLKRRPLSDGEVARLLKSTEQSEKVRYGMTGKDRALIYLAALRTGLRWGELKDLPYSALNLYGEKPTVIVPADIAKNRKEATLPLAPELQTELQRYFGAFPKQSHELALPLPKSDKGGLILSHDLKETGIAVYDAAGKKVDFHSLRHTFITSLVRVGVSPRVVQELARHSSIELTMKYYTHIPPSDQEQAVSKLPPLKSVSFQNSGFNDDDDELLATCHA